MKIVKTFANIAELKTTNYAQKASEGSFFDRTSVFLYKEQNGNILVVEASLVDRFLATLRSLIFCSDFGLALTGKQVKVVTPEDMKADDEKTQEAARNALKTKPPEPTPEPVPTPKKMPTPQTDELLKTAKVFDLPSGGYTTAIHTANGKDVTLECLRGNIADPTLLSTVDVVANPSNWENYGGPLSDVCDRTAWKEQAEQSKSYCHQQNEVIVFSFDQTPKCVFQVMRPSGSSLNDVREELYQSYKNILHECSYLKKESVLLPLLGCANSFNEKDPNWKTYVQEALFKAVSELSPDNPLKVIKVIAFNEVPFQSSLQPLSKLENKNTTSSDPIPPSGTAAQPTPQKPDFSKLTFLLQEAFYSSISSKEWNLLFNAIDAITPEHAEQLWTEINPSLVGDAHKLFRFLNELATFQKKVTDQKNPKLLESLVDKVKVELLKHELVVLKGDSGEYAVSPQQLVEAILGKPYTTSMDLNADPTFISQLKTFRKSLKGTFGAFSGFELLKKLTQEDADAAHPSPLRDYLSNLYRDIAFDFYEETSDLYLTIAQRQDLLQIKSPAVGSLRLKVAILKTSLSDNCLHILEPFAKENGIEFVRDIIAPTFDDFEHVLPRCNADQKKTFRDYISKETIQRELTSKRHSRIVNMLKVLLIANAEPTQYKEKIPELDGNKELFEATLLDSDAMTQLLSKNTEDYLFCFLWNQCSDSARLSALPDLLKQENIFNHSEKFAALKTFCTDANTLKANAALCDQALAKMLEWDSKQGGFSRIFWEHLKNRAELPMLKAAYDKIATK